VALRPWPWFQVLRLFVRSFAADAVLLVQAPLQLALLCTLRGLLPVRKPALVSLDLVLSKPGRGLLERLKAWTKKALFKQVDLFLAHMRHTPELQQYYG